MASRSLGRATLVARPPFPNANSTIDNGRELFGDAFIEPNRQMSAGGFDALRDLDSNGDGVVDVSDTQFANLRLWRDLNQDGVGQANELFTLDSQNIAAINVGSTEHIQKQAITAAVYRICIAGHYAA